MKKIDSKACGLHFARSLEGARGTEKQHHFFNSDSLASAKEPAEL